MHRPPRRAKRLDIGIFVTMQIFLDSNAILSSRAGITAPPTPCASRLGVSLGIADDACRGQGGALLSGDAAVTAQNAFGSANGGDVATRAVSGGSISHRRGGLPHDTRVLDSRPCDHVSEERT